MQKKYYNIQNKIYNRITTLIKFMQKNISDPTDVLSIIIEAILQCRTSPSHPLTKRLGGIQQQLQKCHIRPQLYNECFSNIIHKQQFGTKNKLIKACQTNQTQKLSIQILFTFKNKQNDQRILVQKWQVKTAKKVNIQHKNQRDASEIYLIEQVIRALRCQNQYNELFDNTNLSADYKFKIQSSHVKLQKTLKQSLKQSPFEFDYSWHKSVFFQDFNSLITIQSFCKKFKPSSNIQQKQTKDIQFQQDKYLKKQSFSEQTFQSTQQMILANVIQIKTNFEQQFPLNLSNYKRNRIDSVYEIKDKQFDFTVVSHRKISQQSIGLHHSQIQKQISVEVSLRHHQQYMSEQVIQSSGQFQVLDYQGQQKISNQKIKDSKNQIYDYLRNIDQELENIL